ncbi:Retrovirus-related Pol polyprotein from transposon RE2 [Bienertia sinuspersici]
MADITKIHPATTITNIKACVPITLDYVRTQYSNWSTLFKLHCRAYLVLHHIIPPSDDSQTKSASSSKMEEEKFAELIPWIYRGRKMDDIVCQWIYSTISNDLLNTVISPDDSAIDTWNRLVRLFRGNQSARALQYDTQLSNVKSKQFPGVIEYRTRIKTHADNLRNVDSTISDEQMVLRLFRGLSDEYKSFKTSVQYLVPLPDFETVRTMLELEETNNADDIVHFDAALISNGTAVGTLPDDTQQHVPTPSHGKNKGCNNRHNHRNYNHNNGGNNRYNRGDGNDAAGRGQQDGHQGDRGQQQQSNNTHQSQVSMQQPWVFPPWAMWQQQPWVTPPCPYPTSGYFKPPVVRPPSPSSAPGVLGPQPSQSFYTPAPSPSHASHVPTNIDQAMHTLSLQQPDDHWYMDTGATSHITSSKGNLSSCFQLSNHKNNSIIVGNGSMIPIRGYGNASLNPKNPSLTLKNVLHAPNLVKNLISVRKFANDNIVSVEFDPFGFSVKDMRTGSNLMRCERSGELYPFTTNFQAISSPTPSYAAISSSVWHSRLGHSRDAILSSLRHNNLITCNNTRNTVCHSCPLGKLVKLPFYVLSHILLCHLILFTMIYGHLQLLVI